MLKTSLYNHKAAATGEKPLVPNIVFKSILWLFDNGFKEEADYLYNHYSYTPFQKSFYDTLTTVQNTGKAADNGSNNGVL